MRDLNAIGFFVRVAELGSFTAAAHALGIPKSTVSRRVAQLEEHLGARLLQRTTRRLTLTDLGRVYLSHCQAILAAAESADAVVQQAQGEPGGKVVVTCPTSLAQTLLARALPEFMARFPKVTVDLDATNRRVDVVADGVDMAIRVRPTLEDSSLVLRSFALSHVVVVASPALVAQHGEPDHPLALAQWPSLSMRFADNRHRLRFAGRDGDEVVIELEPRLTTDDMWVLADAAAAGIGFVALPGFVCHRQLEAGQLRVLLPRWSLPAGQIHAVYPYRRGLLPAVRHFVDFLAERLPQLADELGVSRICPEMVENT